MLEKIKNQVINVPQHPFWQNFRDVRFLGFVVFAVMVLLTSWSGVRVIETNYRLQQQIATLEEQNEVNKLKNANLKLQNAYLESDTYLELEARKQFSKGAPGETLLLVPKEVAYQHAPALPKADANSADSKNAPDNRPQYQKNLEAWLRFLFHSDSEG